MPWFMPQRRQPDRLHPTVTAMLLSQPVIVVGQVEYSPTEPGFYLQHDPRRIAFYLSRGDK